MQVVVGQPFAASETGGRANNEDAIYPAIGQAVRGTGALFVVCDGVGGAERGEVASALACEALADGMAVTGGRDVQEAVRYAERRFDAYLAAHPEAAGMATTLTMLAFDGDGGVTVAHIGDSRVYQFRDGRIVFRTEDHSLVNVWVKLGRITAEEAVRHPQRHIITRAIQGSNAPAEADVVRLTDVRPGDRFLLCTDGVTDIITDDALSSLFATHPTPEAVGRAIIDACSVRARDNFSFYIVPILRG